jgi:hypothetical protein
MAYFGICAEFPCRLACFERTSVQMKPAAWHITCKFNNFIAHISQPTSQKRRLNATKATRRWLSLLCWQQRETIKREFMF